MFSAARLDAQLDDGMLRFMGDRTRNRVKNGRLEVSSIFKWFGEDFEAAGGVKPFVARYLEGDAAAAAGEPGTAVRFLDYDWSLNGK